MSEAVLAWPTIMTAIQTELAGVLNNAGAAAFLQVFPGEPLGLPLSDPSDPRGYACFWYLGRSASTTGGPESLGNIMYAARIQIACYWPAFTERAVLPAFEADMAAIDTSIRRALRASSTVNSNVTDLDLTDSTLSYGSFPQDKSGILYRTLMFELHLDNLEGEAIAA